MTPSSDNLSKEEEILVDKLRALKEIGADSSFLSKLRAELMVRFDEFLPMRPTFFFAFRFATAFAAFLMFLAAAGGITLASQKSLPSDFLYPIKIASEKVRVTITSSPSERAVLRVKFAERRLAEVAEIKSKTALAPESIIDTLNNFEEEVTRAKGELTLLDKKGEDTRKILIAAVQVENLAEKNQKYLLELIPGISAVSSSPELDRALDRARNALEDGLYQAGETVIAGAARLRGEGASALPEEVMSGAAERFGRKAARVEAELERLALAFEALEGFWGRDTESGPSAATSVEIIAPEVIPEPSPQLYTPLVLELEEQFALARQKLADIKDKLKAGIPDKERFIEINNGLYQLQLLLVDIQKNLGELERFLGGR